jgi:hypothetical protein
VLQRVETRLRGVALLLGEPSLVDTATAAPTARRKRGCDREGDEQRLN